MYQDLLDPREAGRPAPARSRASFQGAGFQRALRVGLCAAAFEVALKLFLYLRPNPLGAPFALDPAHYVFHAAYYAAWSHGVVALPFALWCAWTQRRALGTSVVRPARAALALQVAIAASLLLVSAVDAECQRFLGMHMSLDWVRTYGAMHRTPSVIWASLGEDRGGTWSSLWGVGATLAFIPCALVAARASRVQFQRRGLIALGVLWLVWPTLLWNVVPGGTQRQTKVMPALMLFWRTAKRPHHAGPSANELRVATAGYQRRWLALDATHAWRFGDPEYPLRRHFVGATPAQPSSPPNIIVLSLETFRAKDMRSMNPALTGPAATPFLDALAAQPDSAFYTRYTASGVPTVYAFTSIHTSLLPHPRYGMHNEATDRHIEGFPGALREHGYRTLHFTGSDPDWDSQRVWLERWYDEVDFSPADHEQDRLTFRRASRRLREVGKQGKPFFAYLSSISNHTPFRSPEPALNVTSGNTARERLHNTMHYTDDVVRELYESLRGEAWFENTIWVITGDHAFDLGDRGESGGHDNLRHETTWVPLIVHGRDPRLPRGAQTGVACHLDLAPTITELAGVFDDNSYMGHSLLHQDRERAFTVVGRAGNYAYESRDFSLYARMDAAPFVYRGSDLEQRHELSQVDAAVLQEAATVASIYDVLVGYTVDVDRVAPRPTTTPHSSTGPLASKH
ncbi:MAG: sulfatase-like hydrolase/transferase [Myxococcales bacterium]